MESSQALSKILGVDSLMLERLDAFMAQKTGKSNVLSKVYEVNQKTIENTLSKLYHKEVSAAHIRSVLRKTLFNHEGELLRFLEIIEGKTQFNRAANLAKKIARVGPGYFLKKEKLEEILSKREPANLLNYLKLGSVEEAIKRHDITELFSSLRFIESDEWMHKTFDEVYSSFTPADFEEREIEVRVLGPEWKEVSERFVAKKHHNVSHLKEFGVIFLNPISEDIPGKFLRDFALFLHYFHEVNFYSKLFRKYAENETTFPDKFKSLLRGDVPEVYKTEPGEWLIVQRYLHKVNPNDPRLFLPRVNPESIHWLRGERDLTLFKDGESKLDLSLWHDLDWVGGVFDHGDEQVVSFDLEDNAMSLVSFMEGRQEVFNYHQRAAMWTRIFFEYVGGEDKAEQLVIENFDKGIIRF